jgi:peptide/nickel transport system permease protein
MWNYLARKLLIYILTLFFAVTLDWSIPRLIPGNPIQNLVTRFASMPAEARQRTIDYYNKAFGLDKPVWEQYLNYWKELFHGNLGISITMYPKPVMTAILEAAPYSLLLLIPTVFFMFYFGNRLGAVSGVNRKVESTVMPFFYFFTSTPQFWLGVILVWIFAVTLKIFPASGAYSYTMLPNLSVPFILDYLYHMILPFLSLFIIGLGGQAIGMRNMILYEMGSNYSRYMESLGSSNEMIRRYAYRNGILPQISGLAIAIAQQFGGQIILEGIFNYPGIGYRIFMAINSLDYFLMQGCFLFIVVAMLIANFTVDIAYMLIDPQVRHSFAGEV